MSQSYVDFIQALATKYDISYELVEAVNYAFEGADHPILEDYIIDRVPTGGSLGDWLKVASNFQKSDFDNMTEMGWTLNPLENSEPDEMQKVLDCLDKAINDLKESDFLENEVALLKQKYKNIKEAIKNKSKEPVLA